MTDVSEKALELQKNATLVSTINVIPLFSGEQGSATFADLKITLTRHAALCKRQEKEKRFALSSRQFDSHLSEIGGSEIGLSGNPVDPIFWLVRGQRNDNPVIPNPANRATRTPYNLRNLAR